MKDSQAFTAGLTRLLKTEKTHLRSLVENAPGDALGRQLTKEVVEAVGKALKQREARDVWEEKPWLWQGATYKAYLPRALTDRPKDKQEAFAKSYLKSPVVEEVLRGPVPGSTRVQNRLFYISLLRSYSLYCYLLDLPEGRTKEVRQGRAQVEGVFQYVFLLHKLEEVLQVREVFEALEKREVFKERLLAGPHQAFHSEQEEVGT